MPARGGSADLHAASTGTRPATSPRDSSLEPFGRDYQAGTAAGASGNGIYLRLPGQWEDETWSEAASGAGVYYNVHRWYQPGVGRYARPDPLISMEYSQHFIYAMANPVTYRDLLGLQGESFPEGGVPCSKISPNPNPNRECCPPAPEAFRNVIRRRQLYCANADNDKPITEMLKSRGAPQGGGPLPEPWIVPSQPRNKCVDECRCFHERVHLRHVQMGVRLGVPTNGMECQAYDLQLKCLIRKTGFEPQGVPPAMFEGPL